MEQSPLGRNTHVRLCKDNPLDEHPTTADPTAPDDAPRPTTPESPDWCTIKSNVKLPVKVAELRRKLYQKAKQETEIWILHSVRP